MDWIHPWIGLDWVSKNGHMSKSDSESSVDKPNALGALAQCEQKCFSRAPELSFGGRSGCEQSPGDSSRRTDQQRQKPSGCIRAESVPWCIHRRSAAAEVAAGEAPHHVQDCGADPQGDIDVHAAIPPRPLLSVPRVRTEFTRRAFSVAGLTVCNTLPANIRLCRSVNNFKRHL